MGHPWKDKRTDFQRKEMDRCMLEPLNLKWDDIHKKISKADRVATTPFFTREEMEWIKIYSDRLGYGGSASRFLRDCVVGVMKTIPLPKERNATLTNPFE